MAQSLLTGNAPVVKPGVDAGRFRADSIAVVREFATNAKAILDSLTALHFARGRIGLLEIRAKRAEDQRDQLAQDYARARADATKLAFQLFDTKDQLGRYRRKRRADQVQLWLVRIGAAFVVYRKICPSCPP